MYSNKYDIALKEKMLMKLEKDRLTAKVDNLSLSLKQQSVDMNEEAGSIGTKIPDKSVSAHQQPQ